MRTLVYCVFLFAFASLCKADCHSGRYLDALPPPKPTDVLFPMPTIVNYGESTITLDKSSFQFTTTSKSTLLERALARYKATIFAPSPINAPKKTMATSSSHAVGGASASKHTKMVLMNNDFSSLASLTSLSVAVSSDNETLQSGVSEAYKLSVSGTQGQISASTVFGALRGLETFSQLVEYTSEGVVIQNTPWVIQDQPRFIHRGLTIDTSRRFIPVPTILRTIDGLAYTKMNVLHWHMVDAQSFPVKIESFPLLTQPFSDEEIYTKKDLQDIVAYAKDRGVRILAEIDSPGHTASWGIGYPEITVCRDKKREDGFCAENPCGSLDPSKNKTFEVVEGVLNEMMDIFPDNLFHFGADEVVFDCWNTPEIAVWMKANNIPTTEMILNYFEQKIFAIAKARNKTPVHWQEVFEHKVKLPENSVIQVWKDFLTLQTVVKAGYKAILSNYQGWYLDCGFANWCSYCSWIDMYQNDPFTNGTALTPAQLALIIGGEAALWSEEVDEYNFDSRIWPRTSAVGERLWSLQSVTNLGDAMQRMLRHSCRLTSRGIHPDPLIPGSSKKNCIYIQE